MAECSSQIGSIQNPRIAWEGCSVLLDINDGNRLVFSRLSSSSSLKIGDKKCSLTPLIGCPFGSLFQLEVGSTGPFLSRVSLAAEEGNHEKVKDDCQLNVDSKDNRALIDNNTAQSLSGEDIEGMRRDGATGDQIVEALISNSSTFETKTLFSQEKYIRRKQRKYAPKVLLRRPFARSICEAYFKKYPARIGFLRVDTLSFLLSMANVSAYSDVLVVDMVGGILTGAVAERLGGTGYVINTYFGIKPYPMDIVGIFNFNNEIRSRIMQSPLSDIAESKNSEDSRLPKSTWSSEIQSNAGEVAFLIPSDGSGLISIEKNVQEQSCPLNTSGQLLGTRETSPFSENGVPHSHSIAMRRLDGMHACDASTVAKNTKLAKAGLRATPEAIKLWKENGFTNLIIAAPELDTWGTVQELLPLLAYSASFAIYHQYLQPLATCMHNLQSAKMAIGLQISEPWLREYQVLPSRTHPCMQMSGFGGYILSGVRICSSEACQHNK